MVDPMVNLDGTLRPWPGDHPNLHFCVAEVNLTRVCVVIHIDDSMGNVQGILFLQVIVALYGARGHANLNIMFALQFQRRFLHGPPFRRT